MPTPLVVDSIATTEVPVSYAAIPATLTRVPLPKVTTVIGTPTLDVNGRPEPAYADAQVTYRDLVNVWGSLRLVVGGKDVTFFRGVSAQIGSYQSQEPYGYGPADFAFPQLSNLEVDKWGTGDLSWFDIGKSVQLVQVDKDLRAVKVLWKGFITALNPTKDGTAVHCDGDASGALALRDKHPALFVFTKDIGVWLFDAFRNCGLALTPYLGAKTGIRVDSRGRSGTYLSYTDGLLAEGMELDGDQWTVMPSASKPGRYKMRLKDRTTVHATAFNGANGVEVDVTRDLSEEPNTIYGSGIGPDGQVWVNGRYPGIKQAPAPPFPGTLSQGDSGDGVIVLKSKLGGMNYLDREDAQGNVFTSDVTDAVKDLQDDANLTQNGIVNAATWDALFDLGVTKLSLSNATPMPLAQDPGVRKWNRTANGSLAGRNPRYVPGMRQVDLSVDHGAGTAKKRARQWSKRKLAQIQNGKNWVGTITLTADVAKGDVIASGPIVPMSRLDLTAGMNIKVRHFDYVTKFHIAGVNVDSDLTVRLAVDTKARDLLTLGQIIERNRASRVNPARQWLRQHRGTDANHAQIQWSEVGGQIFSKVICPGGRWTVFPVIAGQQGSLERIRIATTNSKTPFVAAVFAKKVGPKYLNSKVGHPFDVRSPVTGIALNDGGSGYTSAPTVTFDNSGTGGSGAKGYAVVSGGKVTDVRLTRSGSGYTSAPSISFSGGGGSGASASASIRTGAMVWSDAGIRDEIDAKRVLLWAAGDDKQPGGYWPGQHTDVGPDGQEYTTNDPVTGVLLDDAGVDYHTFGQPVLYVAIFPKNDCELKPQRIFWPVLEAGS